MNAIRKEIEAWIDYKKNFKQNREKILTGRCTGDEEFAEISSEGTPMCRAFDMMCNQCPLYKNICDIQNGNMPIQFVIDMEKQALMSGLTKRAYSMVLTKIDDIISYLERLLRAQGEYDRDVSYEAYYMQQKVVEEQEKEDKEEEQRREKERQQEELTEERPQQPQQPQQQMEEPSTEQPQEEQEQVEEVEVEKEIPVESGEEEEEEQEEQEEQEESDTDEKPQESEEGSKSKEVLNEEDINFD